MSFFVEILTINKKVFSELFQIPYFTSFLWSSHGGREYRESNRFSVLIINQIKYQISNIIKYEIKNNQIKSNEFVVFHLADSD